MEHKTISSMLLAGGLALSASAFGGEASPAMLSNTCAGCHGTNGISVGPASPTIAGLSEAYFTESMMAFKADEEGVRPSTIMARIAKGYTDSEIAAMAKFFSELPYKAAPQKADAAKAASGGKIHKKFCEKCHEKGGRVDDESSILAGQWMPYLHFAMEDFHDGSREMPKKMKKRFKEALEKHGDGAIEELVQFYGSQK